VITYADRISRLPPYIFADLEKLEEDMAKKGVDIISLGIGDPDLRPPRIVTESLKEALNEPGSNNYSSSAGEQYFREAVAEWYQKRFHVKLDPERQVCALIGSKEGLANVGRVLLNAADRALLPDPGYPVYAQGATILSDAVPIVFPLEADMDFHPNFSEIRVDERSKLIFLNYPSNPTGAVANTDMLQKAVDFCRRNGLVLCYDNAYSELFFGPYRSPSPLEIEGSLECTVEFNSCSKMFNMTGFRVGFAVGNETVITGLKKVKTQIDSGIPKFVQKAAATALRRYFDADLSKELEENRRAVAERLDILARGLRRAGLKATVPKATFYLWVNVGMDGAEFVRQLLKVGVVASPGEAFGKNGRRYVRFSVTQPTHRVAEAVERMEKMQLEDLSKLSPSPR
jgi:LL-diaminopimelate aminotransferase